VAAAVVAPVAVVAVVPLEDHTPEAGWAVHPLDREQAEVTLEAWGVRPPKDRREMVAVSAVGFLPTRRITDQKATTQVAHSAKGASLILAQPRARPLPDQVLQHVLQLRRGPALLPTGRQRRIPRKPDPESEHCLVTASGGRAFPDMASIALTAPAICRAPHWRIRRP
jgi:hypothetical protein